MFGQVLRSIAVEKTGSRNDIGIDVSISPKVNFPTGGECLALIVIDEEPFICRWCKVRHSACNGSESLHDHIGIGGMQVSTMRDQRRMNHYLRSAAVNLLDRKRECDVGVPEDIVIGKIPCIRVKAR